MTAVTVRCACCVYGDRCPTPAPPGTDPDADWRCEWCQDCDLPGPDEYRMRFCDCGHGHPWPCTCHDCTPPTYQPEPEPT